MKAKSLTLPKASICRSMVSTVIYVSESIVSRTVVLLITWVMELLEYRSSWQAQLIKQPQSRGHAETRLTAPVPPSSSPTAGRISSIATGLPITMASTFFNNKARAAAAAASSSSKPKASDSKEQNRQAPWVEK